MIRWKSIPELRWIRLGGGGARYKHLEGALYLFTLPSSYSSYTLMGTGRGPLMCVLLL